MTASDRRNELERTRASEQRGLPSTPLQSGRRTRDRGRLPEDFKTATINVRVRADVKEQAAATFEQLGISLPEAIRVFLGRVVSERSFPFPLEVPNAETAAALRESRANEPQAFGTAEDLFDAIEKGVER